MTNSQSVVEYRYKQQGLCYKQQVHLKEWRDYNRKTVRNYLGRIDQKRKQKQTNKSESNYPGKQNVYRPSEETRMKGAAYIKGSVFTKDTGDRIRQQD